jgi:isopentenyldiphosphate isomerase
MEYIDILNSNGQPTGKKKGKQAVHEDGDWHKTVHVWIINSKKELLLQKRAASLESHPNKWDISFAGHVSAGDDSEESVIREAEEEIGLNLDKKDFKYLFTTKHSGTQHNGAYINNEFSDVYIIEKDINIQKLKMLPDEVSEVKYIYYKDLEKRVNEEDDTLVKHEEEYKKLFKVLNGN